MEILEKFVCGKHNDDDCEDGIVVTDDYVAVVDGSTSKTDFTFEGKKPGRMAMELVCEAIRNMPGDFIDYQAIGFITDWIHDFYAKHGLLDHMEKNPLDRFAASAAIVSISRKQLWMIGDCQAIVDDRKVLNEHPADATMAEARAAYIETALQSGKTVEQLMEHDEGREFIMPFLRRQVVLRNNSESPLGYSAFDGFAVAMNKTRFEPLVVARLVVLASDGYPDLQLFLDSSEKFLKYKLEKDPLCIRDFKATKGLKPGNKSFDDRCYVSFRLK